MARFFLTKAKLPEKFWFWAIRKVNLCLNILSITQKECSYDPAFMTTPTNFLVRNQTIEFSFHLDILAHFVVPGMAIIIVIIWIIIYIGDCFRKKWIYQWYGFLQFYYGYFCTPTDYIIDKNCHVGERFSSLCYNGGLTMSILSGKDEDPTQFNIGDRIYVQNKKTHDILERTVTMP